MEERRAIKTEEKQLISYLLYELGVDMNQYPINDSVYEYEGGIMGSISLGEEGVSEYAGDLIQVEYIDSDNIPVLITLTKDVEGQLLDLDFWKEDFSKLIQYPTPDTVVVKLKHL